VKHPEFIFWPTVIALVAMMILAASGCTLTPEVHPELKRLMTPKPTTKPAPLHRFRPGEYPIYNVELSRD
jgi:hypothetical protein